MSFLRLGQLNYVRCRISHGFVRQSKRIINRNYLMPIAQKGRSILNALIQLSLHNGFPLVPIFVRRDVPGSVQLSRQQAGPEDWVDLFQLGGPSRVPLRVERITVLDGGKGGIEGGWKRWRLAVAEMLDHWRCGHCGARNQNGKEVP